MDLQTLFLTFSITVNGAGPATDAPYYPVFPGKANTLALRALDTPSLGRNGVGVELVRILPDGRSDAIRATLSPAQPEAVFDLGAFAVPAEYDFENGVVYRRGYRFRLTVGSSTPGGKPTVFSFYQGPARQADSEALWLGDQTRYVYNSDQSGDTGTLIEALPLAWKFRRDPENAGLAGGWAKTAPGADWAEIRTSGSWTDQPAGRGYHGVAWYALEFRLGAEARTRLARELAGKRVAALRFGAVDGEAEVFLDGVLLARQNRPAGEMWDLPFDVPLPDGFDAAQAHRLAVRVRKESAGAGIWRPVRLLALADRFSGAPNPEQAAFPVGPAWRMQGKDAVYGGQMDPPFELALDPAVLLDPDDVRVCFGRRQGLAGDPVPAKLVVTRLRNGKVVLERDVLIAPDRAFERVDVAAFDPGDYRIELQPSVPGTARREGPRVTYRRVSRDPLAVQVSPLAPWTLTRDPARDELTIRDFRDAITRYGADADVGKWNVGEELTGTGDRWGKPLVLRPGLRGYYAIFARTKGSAYLRAGNDGVVRRVLARWHAGILGGHDQLDSLDHFVVATDMSDGGLAIYQSGQSGQGLVSLRLVPVTAESVAAFEQATSHPPVPLAGVSDWGDFFHQSESRLDADQFELLVKTHAELGMRDLHWAIGRSTLEYATRLPDATRFPGAPLTPDLASYRDYEVLHSRYCPLTEAEKHRERYGVRLQPWLAMNRHYGAEYGGIFQSKWFAAHPEWHEWSKHGGRPQGGRACYFFPEVRRERVDILCELAERGPEGLLVDGVRQPPMLGYHPEMVAAYKKRTGVDPLAIDASAGQAYEDWIRWRAGFFTETLRELQRRLAPIRQHTGKPVPVILRIPSAGLFYSLAQGFEVETWCREKLIDRLELEPLEDFGGRGSHDVRPYVELGRRRGIPVWGGINANTLRNPAAVMKRALGLHAAGVDGLYFYESNGMSATDSVRWLIPLLGDPKRLAAFLENSNVEACAPVKATNCTSGFDNHSRFDGPGSHDVFGRRSVEL